MSSSLFPPEINGLGNLVATHLDYQQPGNIFEGTIDPPLTIMTRSAGGSAHFEQEADVTVDTTKKTYTKRKTRWEDIHGSPATQVSIAGFSIQQGQRVPHVGYRFVVEEFEGGDYSSTNVFVFTFAFEDKGGSDADYNDLIIQLHVLPPDVDNFRVQLNRELRFNR